MFNRSSFSPVSFSRISFNGVQAANEGRSGYWRLFFTNLQEEALKKDEKVDVDAGKPTTPEVVVGESKKQPKSVVSKRSTRIKAPQPKSVVSKRSTRIKAPQPAQSFTPPVLAPVKTLPSVYEELMRLPPLIIEQSFWAFQQQTVIIPIDKERKRRRRKKVAAFLLMAA